MKINIKHRTEKNGVVPDLPWTVETWVKRKRIEKSFATRDEAKAHKTFLLVAFKHKVDPNELREALVYAMNSGHRLVDLVVAGIELLKNNKTVGIDPNLTFEACAKAVIARAEKRNRRPKTIKGYKSAYAVLNRTFGSIPIALITQKMVEDYLDNLQTPEGTPAAFKTKRNALTNIRMALDIGGFIRPLYHLKLGNEGRSSIKYFSNQQVREILMSTPTALRGTIAVMLFAAIRPETMERMEPWQVNAEDGTIRTFEYQNKDKCDHLLELEYRLDDGRISYGLPKVTMEWVKMYGFRPCAWVPLQKYLRAKLGYWVQDGLRHTAATNFYALFGLAATANLLTHKGYSLVKRHYAAIAPKKDAAAFYEIRPETIPPASCDDLPGPKAKRIQWPDRAELVRLLSQHPQKEVAAIIGCSVPALGAYVRKHDIARPGRGQWTPKLNDGAVNDGTAELAA